MPALHRRWTSRQVRALIAAAPLVTPRYELVDGELLVTPSPGWTHQQAVKLLLLALHEFVDREGLGSAVSSPSDVELEPEFLSQPDVFVVPLDEDRRVRAEGLPVRRVMLAVEILSPSSSRHDRVRKRPKYQAHIPEYWIVDPDARLIERWCTGDDRPEILTDALVWKPQGAREALRIELAPFFANVCGDEAR